jgi:hypothetical protein
MIVWLVAVNGGESKAFTPFPGFSRSREAMFIR